MAAAWTLVPALALASVLCVPEKQHFEYAPVEGQALQRSWAVEQDLRTEKLTMRIGEKVMPTAFRLHLTTRESVDVIDECLRGAEEQVLEMRRSFVQLSRSVRMADLASSRAPLEAEQSSPLESVRVRYQWQPDKGACGKHYEGEREAAESTLAGLPDELGFVALLPAGDVAPLATWKVDLARLGRVFAPFGALPYDVPPGADAQLLRTVRSGIGGNLQELFAGTAEGDASVVFAAIEEEEGGPRIARLELQLRVKLTRDQTAFANRERTFAEKREGLTHPSAVLQDTVVGEGVLRWNLDAQRTESFEFEGTQSLKQTITSRYPSDAEDGARVQTAEMSGALALSMTTGPAVSSGPGEAGD